MKKITSIVLCFVIMFASVIANSIISANGQTFGNNLLSNADTPSWVGYRHNKVIEKTADSRYGVALSTVGLYLELLHELLLLLYLVDEALLGLPLFGEYLLLGTQLLNLLFQLSQFTEPCYLQLKPLHQ